MLLVLCMCFPLIASAQNWWELQEKALPLPMARCRKIDRDLVLSGKMDDPLWQQAATVELTKAASGQPGKKKTTARFLYNDRYLYLGFSCEADYVWSTKTKRDDELWKEEVVELFVSPTGSLHNYYEFEINPLNTQFDQFVLNNRGRNDDMLTNTRFILDYNIDGLITKSFVDGEMNKPGAAKMWTVEMAIPFIGPDQFVPVHGTQWRLNLYRQMQPRPGIYDFLAWSPTIWTDAHRPWRFGYLTFVDDQAATLPAAPKVDEKPLPVFTAAKVNRDVVLSGKLDDPLWQQAEVITLVNASDGTPGQYATTARLLYTERYLYIGYTCDDPYIVSRYTRRDDPLYEQDVVEAFISPSGSIRQYFEVETSPRNVIADTFVLNGRARDNMTWKNFHTFFNYDIEGLYTRASYEGKLDTPDGGTRYCVEMAIPLQRLYGYDALPTPGTRWRINLFRCDLKPDNTMDFYAASPIMEPSDLHRPWRMGILQFGEAK